MAREARARSTENLQQVRSAATRNALIAAGRDLFGKLGYAAAGTNDLVAAACVTRGALYHHFADKEDLFAAVSLQVAEEVTRAARESVEHVSKDPWRRIVEGTQYYLQLIVSNPDAQRILLIDGPAVLGWRNWRDLQMQIGLPALARALEKMMDEGALRRCPAEPLAYMINAACHDAALSAAHSPEPDAARQSMSQVLAVMMEGLRIA